MLVLFFGSCTTEETTRIRKGDKLLNAYYFRAHTYTMVPKQIREDLQWMKNTGTDIVSVAVLEQDLYAAKENLKFICDEAKKLGMQVHAVPSRWGGLVAGAPKVPSVFTCQNPDTWICNKDGSIKKSNISGCLSSIHHPKTLEFMINTTRKMLQTWDFDGVVWDEPKTLGMDYSEMAKEALGDEFNHKGQVKANAKFYSAINKMIKKEFPNVATSMFLFASVGNTTMNEMAKTEMLDYFGCDGRPWSNTDGGKLESKGKVLLGDDGGERFIDAARKNGMKALWLIENHNMSDNDIPVLKRRLPEVVKKAPEQLIYYYYPRNIQSPEVIMNIIKKEVVKY